LLSLKSRYVVFTTMDDKLRSGLNKAGIAQAERHVFICLGPECCSRREGEMLWDFVKKRVKETGVRAMRTKADCFRICTGGPWMVVYPDGVWYGRVTPARFERILQQHLMRGEVVTEWVSAQNRGCSLRPEPPPLED
jgi:(2Fe-2S) ferredoxin